MPTNHQVAVVLLATVTLFTTVAVSAAILCVQCDKVNRNHLTNRTNRTTIQDCLLGRMAASPCSNASHTHCIASYYRDLSLPGANIIVTWRKCGTSDDVGHCRQFSFPRQRRMKRRRRLQHQRDDDGSQNRQSQHRLRHSQQPGHHRRRWHNAAGAGIVEFDVIEVCSQGCDRDHCLIGSNAVHFGHNLLLLLLLPAVITLLSSQNLTTSTAVVLSASWLAALCA